MTKQIGVRSEINAKDSPLPLPDAVSHFPGKYRMPAEILNVKEKPRELSFSLILTELTIFVNATDSEQKNNDNNNKKGGLNMSKASNVRKQ